MSVYNPMFHMDQDYMWRWYVTDARGKPAFMSAGSFFFYEEARRDYDAVQRRSGPHSLH